MEFSEECAERSNGIVETAKELDIWAIPVDIIFNILARVPIKSLLRSESVSKAWLSWIHSAVFAATFHTRALENPGDRYSLLVIGKDKSTYKNHFLSAPWEGGSTTQLFTLATIPLEETETNILNGLVLFHRQNGYMKHNFAFIINPSTHDVMKLPGKAAQPRFSYGNVHICYFFGFDPSTQGFKVLNVRIIGLKTPEKMKIECGLFDLGSCSWKRVNPVFPFDPLEDDWLQWFRKNICIDGVIYILLHKSYVLVAFDLKEESFSLIPLPQGVIPSDIATKFAYNRAPALSFNYPYMMNYNGKLAVICIEKAIHHKIVEMWILKDKENQQWLKETIILPESLWDRNSHSLPRNVIFTGEVMFTPRMISKECMRIPLYDMNQRSFRFIEILVPPSLASDNIQFRCPGGYVENISRLKRS